MPKKYTIETHDTLWDLSSKFYGNPTLWPLIFEYNNLPHITKRTGSRIIDPDLILIGQKLIIPDKKLADKLGEQGLKKVISNICENRAHHEKNPQNSTQVHELRQYQSNNEQIAHTPAKKVQPPFFEFDLGKIPIREVNSGLFRIVMRASGTLVLHTSGASPAITVQGLDNLKSSARYFAENAAGKLFSDTSLEFNAKTKTVKFSNKLTTQSNLPNHPSVSLAFETNAQGKPALVGSMTQNLVKGKIDSHTFVGEKIGIEIEVTREKEKDVGDPEKVLVNAPEGATANKPVTPEDTIWAELGLIGGAIVMAVGGVAMVAKAIRGSITRIARGQNNDASFSFAKNMLITAKKDGKDGGVALWNRFSTRFLAGAGLSAAPAMAQPESTGLLDEED